MNEVFTKKTIRFFARFFFLLHLLAVYREATADQYSEKVLSTKTQRELTGRWVVELDLGQP